MIMQVKTYFPQSSFLFVCLPHHLCFFLLVRVCPEQQRGPSRQQSDSKRVRSHAWTEEIHEESHAFCSHDQGKCGGSGAGGDAAFVCPFKVTSPPFLNSFLFLTFIRLSFFNRSILHWFDLIVHFGCFFLFVFFNLHQLNWVGLPPKTLFTERLCWVAYCSFFVYSPALDWSALVILLRDFESSSSNDKTAANNIIQFNSSVVLKFKRNFRNNLSAV